MKSYTIFSVILFLLLVGALGTNIYTQYQLTQQRNQYNQQIALLQNQVDAQKNAKNTIRDLWENQAADNDNLIAAQSTVDDKTQAYQAEIKKSIRFINTVPQLLPGANEADLNAATKDLSDAQSALDAIITQNVTDKTTSKSTVDAIYLNLGETQTNRANPRSGTN
jgi:hypothetical protein